MIKALEFLTGYLYKINKEQLIVFNVAVSVNFTGIVRLFPLIVAAKVVSTFQDLPVLASVKVCGEMVKELPETSAITVHPLLLKLLMDNLLLAVWEILIVE